MRESSKNNIIAWLEEVKKPVTAHELAEKLGVSRVTVHTHLKNLVAKGVLIKQGTSPKVRYSLGNSPYPQIQKSVRSVIVDATQKISTLAPSDKKYLDRLYFMHLDGLTSSEIKKFIANQKISAIAFVPPTASRESQFVKELQQMIVPALPVIGIEKIIAGTEEMLLIYENSTFYKKVLIIIDDLTGSGTTLNVLAKQMKHQLVADTVTGLVYFP